MIAVDYKMNMNSKWNEKPNVILELLDKVCSMDTVA